MRSFLRIILVVTAFFCMASFDACASKLYASHQEKKECIVREKHSQHLVTVEDVIPVTNALTNTRNSQRIGSTRPMRHLPTFGGKSNRTQGKLLSGNTSKPFKTSFLFLRYVTSVTISGAASPRFYYVIALRRILC